MIGRSWNQYHRPTIDHNVVSQISETESPPTPFFSRWSVTRLTHRGRYIESLTSFSPSFICSLYNYWCPCLYFCFLFNPFFFFLFLLFSLWPWTLDNIWISNELPVIEVTRNMPKFLNMLIYNMRISDTWQGVTISWLKLM